MTKFTASVLIFVRLTISFLEQRKLQHGLGAEGYSDFLEKSQQSSSAQRRGFVSPVDIEWAALGTGTYKLFS